MAKLTRAQRQSAQTALSCLNRAWAFLAADGTAVCRTGEINGAVPYTGKGDPGTEFRAAESYRTQDYEGRDGSAWTIHWHRTLTPINKNMGSDLVALHDARRALRDLLGEE